MNCYECNKAIIDNKFYYSFEDTNEICPKCYGIELDTHLIVWDNWYMENEYQIPIRYIEEDDWQDLPEAE